MKIWILALIFAVAPMLVMADMTIVSKVENGPVMGQPAHKGTQTSYIKGDKARMDLQGGQYMIFDLTTGKIGMVDPTKKQVVMMSKEQLDQWGGMMQKMGDGQKMMQSDVKKLGTSRTVNGFKCDDYQVNVTGLVTVQSVQCISTDIDMKELERFKPFMEKLSKSFGGYEDKLPGFPVQSKGKTSLMGQEFDSSTEVVSISHDSIPDSVFVIPADYKNVQAPAMPQMPQQ